jgi:hypothetical protein
VDLDQGVYIDLGGGNDSPTITEGRTRDLPIVLDGADGDDRLSGRDFAGGGEALLGGPGNDRLDGLGGADLLLGEGGDDVLNGDAGGDELHGGAGDDRLVGDGLAAHSADLLDGGVGFDTIEDWNFVSDARPISVTFDAGADDGFAGEGDEVSGVESVSTSSPGRIVGGDGADALYAVNGSVTLEGRGGDDELRGAGGADTLDGGPGADKLVGGYGSDHLVGGSGPDAIVGDRELDACNDLSCDPGNDLIEARDGEVDSISCGTGTDRVVADATDVVSGDCEQVERPATPPIPPTTPAGPKSGGSSNAPKITIAKTSLRAALAHGLRLTLTGLAPGRRSVTASLKGRTLAKGTIKVPASGRASARLTFGRKARRALRGRRSVALVIRAGTAKRTITLKG